MKKQEIRKAYTEKVSELLADGYIIFPDTIGFPRNNVFSVVSDGMPSG